MTTAFTQQEITLKSVIEGLENGLPAGTTRLVIEGETFVVKDLIVLLKGYHEKHKVAREAAAAFHTAVRLRDEIVDEERERLKGLQATLKTLFGSKSDRLAAFGFTPEKGRVVLSTEEKLAKIEKSRATRVARQTKGKNQRKKIKGTPRNAAGSSTNAAGKPKDAPGTI